MFYVNKKDNKDVQEMIFSNQEAVIVVTQQSILDKKPSGKIIKCSKKEYKKDFKKAPQRLIKVKPISKSIKKDIIGQFLDNQSGLLEYTEEFLHEQEMLDRIDFHNNQTPEQREQMLRELADK